jgi:hypothetical protein
MKRRLRLLRCSFCRRSEREVGRLMAGHSGYICDACVGVCNKILETAPPAAANWGDMSNEQLLAALVPASATVEATRSVLQMLVEALRERSVSWADIGDALGISRQAAWERFG